MKICNGCSQKRVIYKAHGVKKYCKSCWGKYLSGETPASLQKVQPIAKKSEKKEKLDYLYSIARKQYLERKPMCEARLPGCSLNATDIHHKRGRVGEYYLDTTHFLAVCRSCHTIIETQVEMAKEEGFSESRLIEPNEKD